MINVEMRRNSDGKIAKYTDGCEWDSGYDFMWSFGNYSCDCNRYLFFMRAVGEDEGKLIDDRCADGGYPVRITDDAGKLLYRDGEWT